MPSRRVNHGPEALCRGLTARGVNLRIAHGTLAAVENAIRCENLHHVGANGGKSANEDSDCGGISGFGCDGLKRGQHAGPWYRTTRDEIAYLGIVDIAQTLNRGETRHHCRVRIL